MGGAVGDALGAAVEFMSLQEIRKDFGPSGIAEYAVAFGRIGAITDDTQMTLFTAEGLLHAYIRAALRGMVSVNSVVCLSYLRWLHTQGLKSKTEQASIECGWLIQERELFSPRAPGNTCISALREMARFTSERAENNSKGAGGIMRIAPAALMFAARPDEAARVFKIAKEAAWLTHGHPSGYLAAGAFAVVLHALLCGNSVLDGVEHARTLLKLETGNSEVLRSMDLAISLASNARNHDDAIAALGGGWIAEEAFGISLYCTLKAADFSEGIRLAVNHDGDSDTTGSLVGQLLGAMCGYSNIPTSWTDSLELKDVILTVADDLSAHEKWNLDYMDSDGYDKAIVERYLGS